MPEPIVIVAYGLRLPGANDPGTFWANILSGKTEFRPCPPQRWPLAPSRYVAAVPTAPALDQVTTDMGCFVESDRDDEVALDPLFELVLAAGREAWEGAQTRHLDLRRVQVILGSILLPTAGCTAYAQRFFEEAGEGRSAATPVDAANTQVGGLPATMLANALAIQGSAYTLDAACASSLYALKLGCDALQNRAADAVLVGGVNHADSLYTQMGFSALGALSKRGECTPFDQCADGLVVGEGAAIFVLKRETDARVAGDRILGRIAGIGLSNDLGGSLMAPDSEGQLRAMRAAYEAAGWEPASVELIECHGTGTPVGDATEISSLTALWGGAAIDDSAVIGSVKGNIGHLLTGAGAAALAKVLLALDHQVFPPTAGYSVPGTELSPFEVLSEPRARAPAPRAMRAAVSAFGFGGINAHVLLEAPSGNPSSTTAVVPSAPASVAIVGIGAHVGPWPTRKAVLSRLIGPDLTPPAAPQNWLNHPQASQFPGYYIERISLSPVRLSAPPRELEQSLPQQLVALDVGKQAMEDAGLGADANPKRGVYLGTSLDLNTTNYTLRWRQLALGESGDALAGLEPLNANRTMGGLGSIAASRIARAQSAGGPAFTVSSGECSGITALAAASAALCAGEIDEALVAAVDLAGDPRTVMAKQAQLGTHPLVPGEGGVAFVLMRESDARETGKHIYALLGDVHQLTEPDGADPTRASRASERFGQCGAAQGALELLCAAANLAPGDRTSVFIRSDCGATARVEVAAPHDAAPWQVEDIDGATAGPMLTFENRAGPRLGNQRVPRAKPLEPLARPTPVAHSLVAAVGAAQRQTGTAHGRFLEVNNVLVSALSRLIEAHPASTGTSLAGPGPALARVPAPQSATGSAVPGSAPKTLTRDECLAFAVAKIGPVLGPQFDPIDDLPSRVRLPDEPLMLVDRITAIDAEPLSMQPGRLVTEHDIVPGAWYLDADRIPTCIAIEAGQADLFLSAYLGIDLETQGNAVYRLLDAAVTFHGPLPQPGDTIRYDIRITRFFRLGTTHMFRFEFDGTVRGETIVQMRDGTAGFFSTEELARGKGLLPDRSRDESTSDSGPLAWDLAVRPDDVERYDSEQLDALRAGSLTGCFGHRFGHDDAQSFARLPGGRMRLVHRISALDAQGGRFGCGLVVGEADIRGDEWFLACHFIDDEVMPGTLMYECCLHTLRVFLLRYGWTGPRSEVGEKGLSFEPVAGVTSRLQCRGQVTEGASTVQYEIHLRSLDYNAHGRGEALADAVMSVDGRPIVYMENLCVTLHGVDRATLESTWGTCPTQPHTNTVAPVFTHAQVLEFASGRPSAAFGHPYTPFDTERRLARLPRPPYNFLHRIVAAEECAAWDMRSGGRVTAHYDVEPQAWYGMEYGDRQMPYAVVLEVGLQACGWLAAYMGSALVENVDLSFRNLEGSAAVHAPVRLDEAQTLTTKLTLLDVSQAAQMIIQRYEFDISGPTERYLSGETTFGFFTADALRSQSGLTAPPSDRVPETHRQNITAEERAHWLEAAGGADRLRLLNALDVFVPPGIDGPFERLRASSAIDAQAWFFEAHFYQDPVYPGSLGLEAFVQLLRAAAIRRWGNHHPWRLNAKQRHHWTYRGQILPQNTRFSVEAVVVDADDAERTLEANGVLSVDGLDIYRMEGFTLGPA